MLPPASPIAVARRPEGPGTLSMRTVRRTENAAVGVATAPERRTAPAAVSVHRNGRAQRSTDISSRQRRISRHPEAAVATEGADGGELAGSGPTGHGLRVHAEHRRDLGRGEQLLGGVEVVVVGHGVRSCCPVGTSKVRKVRLVRHHGPSGSFRAVSDVTSHVRLRYRWLRAPCRTGPICTTSPQLTAASRCTWPPIRPPACGPSSPCTPRCSGPSLGGTRFRPYAELEAAVARRVPAGPGHDLQARRLRQRPGRRQGRDHRRPGRAAHRGAAAGLRPVPALPRRHLPHRRGRRHHPGRHGPAAVGHAVRHRHQPRARRLGRPVAGHGVGRALRHGGRWPSGSGASPSLEGRHVVVARHRQGRRRAGPPPARGRRPAHARRRAGRRRRRARRRARRRRRRPGRRGRSRVECDILSPCALGAVLVRATIPTLRCAAVCGAANNQLATDADGEPPRRRRDPLRPRLRRERRRRHQHRRRDGARRLRRRPGAWPGSTGIADTLRRVFAARRRARRAPPPRPPTPRRGPPRRAAR